MQNVSALGVCLTFYAYVSFVCGEGWHDWYENNCILHGYGFFSLNDVIVTCVIVLRVVSTTRFVFGQRRSLIHRPPFSETIERFLHYSQQAVQRRWLRS